MGTLFYFNRLIRWGKCILVMRVVVLCTLFCLILFNAFCSSFLIFSCLAFFWFIHFHLRHSKTHFYCFSLNVYFSCFDIFYFGDDNLDVLHAFILDSSVVVVLLFTLHLFDYNLFFSSQCSNPRWENLILNAVVFFLSNCGNFFLKQQQLCQCFCCCLMTFDRSLRVKDTWCLRL